MAFFNYNVIAQRPEYREGSILQTVENTTWRPFSVYFNINLTLAHKERSFEIVNGKTDDYDPGSCLSGFA